MENWLSVIRRIHEHSAFNLVLGVLLLLTGVLLSDIPTMTSSLTWPNVPGVITSRRLMGHKFEEYDGDYYTHIEGNLQYSYTVKGVDFDGSAVNALEAIFYPESIVRKYSVGQVVAVFYDPEQPSRAVLEPGFVFSGQAFGLPSTLCCWGGVCFLGLGLWRRITGRRYILRGWPDDSDYPGQGKVVIGKQGVV